MDAIKKFTTLHLTALFRLAFTFSTSGRISIVSWISMSRLLFSYIVFSPVLLGCAGEAKPDATDELKAGNKMTCIVNGTTLTATGDEVEIGSFGIGKDTVSLSLSLVNNKNGAAQFVSTGLMNIPTKVGHYYFPSLDDDGYGGGSYKIENQKGELIKNYSGADYWLYYAREEKDPTTKLQISFTKMEQTPADLPGFVRIKMSGNFKFKAAYVSMTDGRLSDACTTEAITRSIKQGPRFPKYNAKLCGAEEIEVSGTFEVTNDFNNAH